MPTLRKLFRSTKQKAESETEAAKKNAQQASPETQVTPADRSKIAALPNAKTNKNTDEEDPWAVSDNPV